MRFVLITGHQRSGTSVYRGALARHPKIRDFGEIMTPVRAEADDPASFWQFWRPYAHHAAARPKNSADPLRDYLQFLSDNHSEPTGLIDVKINFLHNFFNLAQLPTAPPALIKIFIRRNYPIIHFHRRNVLDQYVSLQIGIVSKTWHLPRDSATLPAIKPFAVNLDDARQDMAAMVTSSALLRRWLHGYAGAHEFIYDDLYRNDRLTAPYQAATKAIFGLEDSFDMGLPFQRTAPLYTEIITNLSDLADVAAEVEASETAKWLSGVGSV